MLRTATTTGPLLRRLSGVTNRTLPCSRLLPPSPSPLPPFVADTATTSLDTRLLGIHRRGFASSALRLKERPPENNDSVEDSVGQEVKQKQRQQEKGKIKEEEKEPEKGEPGKEPEGGVRIDSEKRGPGIDVPSPGEAPKGRAAAAAAGGGGAVGGESGGASGGTRPPTPTNRALQKPIVPDIYPQVMALPITKRPLFPGFYKAVTIKDPNVAGAIREMIKRGQPYIGAFLFKDEDADGDTIEKLDDVHAVGVFAQVTSAFPVHGEEGSLTAVLYPHRRIRITGLQARASAKSPEPPSPSLSASSTAPEPGIEQITEEYLERQDKGDVVASFEEPTEWRRPSHASGEYATSFLRKYDVSIVDVENLVEEPHDKKDPVIRAVTSEIVNVFKEVATLNPLFRDQISTFSISQSAGNVIEEPAKLADFAAAVSSGEVGELQDVLESLSVVDRLQKALMVIKKELMNAQLQSKISKDVEAKIQKRQREYWLLEQLKGIKRELGIESDGKDKLVDSFREKAAKLTMPEAVKKVFSEVGSLSLPACLVALSLLYRSLTSSATWSRRRRSSMSLATTSIGLRRFPGANIQPRTIRFRTPWLFSMPITTDFRTSRIASWNSSPLANSEEPLRARSSALSGRRVCANLAPHFPLY